MDVEESQRVPLSLFFEIVRLFINFFFHQRVPPSIVLNNLRQKGRKISTRLVRLVRQFIRYNRRICNNTVKMPWLELLERFTSFLLVTKLFFHDFLKFSWRLPCIKLSLIQFNFMLLKRCILNLAAILRHEVLRVSLKSNSNFTAFSMQINFVHIINFNVASYT